MDMGVHMQMGVGSSSLYVDDVWSDPFRVYLAKDFPGMLPTPFLAQQLKMLGARGIRSRAARGCADDEQREG
jgi:hypothetical protein